MTSPGGPSRSGGQADQNVSGARASAGSSMHHQSLDQQMLDSQAALTAAINQLVTTTQTEMHASQMLAMANNPAAAGNAAMLRQTLFPGGPPRVDAGAGGFAAYGQHRAFAAQRVGDYIAGLGGQRVNYSAPLSRPQPYSTLPAPLQQTRVMPHGDPSSAPIAQNIVTEAADVTPAGPTPDVGAGGGAGSQPPPTAGSSTPGGDDGSGPSPGRGPLGGYRGARRAGPVQITSNPVAQRALGTMGSTIARSGGTLSGLRNAISDTVPIASMLFGGYDRAMQLSEEGRNYQRVIGGNRVEGMQEYGHEQAYAAAMRFTPFGSKNAEAAYEGVTNLGFTGMTEAGGGRNAALNFIYHNFNTRGMNVQDSLQMLQQATQIGVTNLSQLSNAIKDVSETARTAGVNAQSARQLFTSMMGQAGTLGAGTGAPQLASIMTDATVSGGRYYSQAVNRSGELSTNMQYQVAAYNGITPGAAFNMSRTAPAQYAQMLGGQENLALNSVLTSEQLGWIDNAIRQAGGGAALKRQPQFLQNIAQGFLSQYQNQIQPQVIAQFMTAITGTTYSDPFAALMDLVKIRANQGVGGNAAAAANANAKTNAQGQVIDSNGKVSGTAQVGTKANNYAGLLQGERPTGIDPNTGQTTYTGTGQVSSGINATSFTGRGGSGASQAYYGNTGGGKTRDPIIESLLTKMKRTNSDMSNSARKDVVVHTASGDRKVSWAEAIKDFPDEIAAGQITVINGAFKGKDISAITGLSARSDEPTLSGASAETANASLGNVGSQYKPKTTAQGDNVKLTIGWADPNMANIFTTQQSQANASGNPLPTGGPGAASRQYGN